MIWLNRPSHHRTIQVQLRVAHVDQRLHGNPWFPAFDMNQWMLVSNAESTAQGVSPRTTSMCGSTVKIICMWSGGAIKNALGVESGVVNRGPSQPT
jgi:hypothetical protein